MCFLQQILFSCLHYKMHGMFLRVFQLSCAGSYWIKNRTWSNRTKKDINLLYCVYLTILADGHAWDYKMHSKYSLYKGEERLSRSTALKQIASLFPPAPTPLVGILSRRALKWPTSLCSLQHWQAQLYPRASFHLLQKNLVLPCRHAHELHARVRKGTRVSRGSLPVKLCIPTLPIYTLMQEPDPVTSVPAAEPPAGGRGHLWDTSWEFAFNRCLVYHQLSLLLCRISPQRKKRQLPVHGSMFHIRHKIKVSKNSTDFS